MRLNLPQKLNMSHDHDHHGHAEAEQNEIAGPVVFAITCLAIAVVIIYFWAQ